MNNPLVRFFVCLIAITLPAKSIFLYGLFLNYTAPYFIFFNLLLFSLLYVF